MPRFSFWQFVVCTLKALDPTAQGRRASRRTLGSPSPISIDPERVGAPAPTRVIVPLQGTVDFFGPSTQGTTLRVEPWAERSNAFSVFRRTRQSETRPFAPAKRASGVSRGRTRSIECKIFEAASAPPAYAGGSLKRSELSKAECPVFHFGNSLSVR